MVTYTKLDKLLKSKIGSPLEITLEGDAKMKESPDGFYMDIYLINNPGIIAGANKLIGYLEKKDDTSIVLSRELVARAKSSKIIIYHDAIRSYKILK